MYYVRNGSTDPHFNMAFDEFCLERMTSDVPFFYLWQNRPSVIIGLNQNPYAEVNLPYLEENGITLARRVTGGGAVYHDLGNINYTIVGPSSPMEHGSLDYYALMTEALRSLGVDASRSGRNDIMVDGKKCSGYAKRMWKDRVMIHGTLMYDVDIEALTMALSVPGSKLSAAGIHSVRSRVANLREYLPQFGSLTEFRESLQDVLSSGDGEICLPEGAETEIAGIAAEKFSTWDWIYGRSPSAQFKASGKLPCGTVEISWSVLRGCLSGVCFSGDFLGNLPAGDLACKLEGCRFSREDLEYILEESGTADYFDSTSAGQIVKIFGL